MELLTIKIQQMNIESSNDKSPLNPPLLIASVSGSVYLTENQIAELAQIGSQHLYLGAMDEGRISYGGIMEILKRYEEFRKTDR